ncbi:MAG: histidine ammonia-lyase [Actinomycetota bacterium]|nr:histidine ammonia-lyase [Actinomycetota bacterium]
MAIIGEPLDFQTIERVARDDEQVELASDVAPRMAAARRVVEDLVSSGETSYGINTGFGGLANVRIPPDELERLQLDIVRSHATAVGEPLPRAVVRAMLLLRARTFAFGVSGIRYEIVQGIVDLLNAGITPVVPSQGSLGASGDLAPLAHLALPLIGEGKAELDGKIVTGAEALSTKGLAPITLSFKEGLALVNGTEMMLALGILTYQGAVRLAKAADLAGAMTLEACLGTDHAFDADLIALRKHLGAVEVAQNMRNLLAGSDIVASHRESEHLVQDAYSLRCIPQVHGAYRDGFDYVFSMLQAELDSAIDNPTVLPGRNEVLSGGNFHGEALGLALDHLALCLTGFATISERRIARLVDPDLNNGLPAFLSKDPGRRSGFMLPSYTAASLVSENRSLSFPASADSISTSAGQEDHVSMGATSGRKAATILANSENVIAIELLSAAQGLDLRGPLSPAPATAAVRDRIRSVSPALEDDRSLSGDIGAVRGLVRDGNLIAAAEDSAGSLA